MIEIKSATADDFCTIWPIFHDVVSTGDTYPYPINTSRNEAKVYWMGGQSRTYIALQHSITCGTYYLKPNQPGSGDHVANAGFMVAPDVAGSGIGTAMVEHSLSEAVRLGFRAMQFNLVVSTNIRAIALWERVGFHITGSLPEAFRHPTKGFVDAHVMYRSLKDRI